LTLWNQQGSHVRRGALLVIPSGRALLYAEPIYLQAERSPMPELRLVVLALQDRLASVQMLRPANCLLNLAYVGAALWALVRRPSGIRWAGLLVSGKPGTVVHAGVLSRHHFACVFVLGWEIRPR
jgi:hypothetical protein